MNENGTSGPEAVPRAGRMRGLCGSVARAVGAPYAAVLRVRRWAYRRGVLCSDRASVPVVCVGNLSVGGTGKTPMVAWVVACLREIGRRPAVLIRGYRARAGRSDEAVLLEASCGALVFVNPDRRAAAAAAVRAGADVLVMDDGFQHLRLHRDLDLVLVDATAPLAGGACLPLGRLREGPSALRDAGAVVLTRADQVPPERLAGLRRLLAARAPRACVAAAVHRPVKVVDEAGRDRPPECLAGRKVFLFCGIGNPRAFAATARGLGARGVGTRFFRDHAAYGPDALERLARRARQAGADLLLTTQKDFVKLPPGAFQAPLWHLVVEMRLVEGEEALRERICAALACGAAGAGD